MSIAPSPSPMASSAMHPRRDPVSADGAVQQSFEGVLCYWCALLCGADSSHFVGLDDPYPDLAVDQVFALCGDVKASRVEDGAFVVDAVNDESADVGGVYFLDARSAALTPMPGRGPVIHRDAGKPSCGGTSTSLPESVGPPRVVQPPSSVPLPVYCGTSSYSSQDGKRNPNSVAAQIISSGSGSTLGDPRHGTWNTLRCNLSSSYTENPHT